MKETNTTTNNTSAPGRIKRSFIVLIAGTMIATAAAGITAASTMIANAASTSGRHAVTAMNTISASARIKADQYKGHDIISGEFEKDGFKVDFKYSDGFFETVPKEYDPHIAAMSCDLAYSSATVENGTDFSEGPKTIKDLRQPLNTAVGLLAQILR